MSLRDIKYVPMTINIIDVDKVDNIIDAWNISRPLANVKLDNTDEISKILKLDLPVNEMMSFTLDMKVPLLIREVFTTLRDHVVWARTSRVDDLTKWEVYGPETTSNTDVEDLYDKMIKAKEAGIHQDHFRKYLPLGYMTEFTTKISLRNLLKVIRFMIDTKSLNKFGIEMKNSLLKSYLHHKNYNENVANLINNPCYKPFIYPNLSEVIETEDGFSNCAEKVGNFIIAQLYNVNFNLRAQLVRTRGLSYTDNLIHSCELAEATIGMDAFLSTQSSDIEFTIQIAGTVDTINSMVSSRNCWLAQKDLWEPVLNTVNAVLGAEAKLPCSSGSCPFDEDCKQRYLGKDPGVPCPMNCFRNNLKVSSYDSDRMIKYAEETNRVKSLKLICEKVEVIDP